MAKGKKRRVFKVKNILLLLFLFLGIVGLVYYGLTMPVKNVYIKGNYILSDGEIMKISALDKYPSFLLTSSKSIRDKIIKNSYVKDVKISKKFGNVIEVNILEYSAVFSFEDKIILSNGKIIPNTYNLSDVPILLNMIDDSSLLKRTAIKFGGVDANVLRQISEVEYQPVEVDEDRFLLYMNDGNLVYITLTKINKINKYNQIRDKLDGHMGIIYLDAGDYVELKS